MSDGRSSGNTSLDGRIYDCGNVGLVEKNRVRDLTTHGCKSMAADLSQVLEFYYQNLNIADSDYLLILLLVAESRLRLPSASKKSSDELHWARSSSANPQTKTQLNFNFVFIVEDSKMSKLPTIIALLALLVILTAANFRYTNSITLPLFADTIIWSDARYVALYGPTTTLVVDLQQSHERFRNTVNVSESNVTISGRFRARGRSAARDIAPKCSLKGNSSIRLKRGHYVSGQSTYFIVEDVNFKMGVLNEACVLSIHDFGPYNLSDNARVVGIDDSLIGVAGDDYLYLLLKPSQAIFQQLALSLCWQEAAAYEVTYYPKDAYGTSFMLALSTPNSICLFSRASSQSAFNFVGVGRHNFNAYGGLSVSDYSLGYLVSSQCQIISLNLTASINSQGLPTSNIDSDIVGRDVFYSSSTNWMQDTIVFLRNRSVKRVNPSGIYDWGPLPATGNVTAACISRNTYSETTFYFFVDEEGPLKRWYNSNDPTIMNSSKLSGISAMSCNGFTVNGTDVGVLVGTVADGQLRVSYFYGQYDILQADFSYPLPPSEQSLLGLHRSVQQISTDYYQLTFFAVVSTTTERLTCYSFSVEGQSIRLVGSSSIESDYQFMDNKYDPSYIYWHEVVGQQHVLWRLDSNLVTNQFPLGDDFKSFTVGYKGIRILREGGRSDLYKNSYGTTAQSRSGSIITGEWQDEQLSIINGYDDVLVIKTSTGTRYYNISLSLLFLSQTMGVLPAEACSNSSLAPIVSSIYSNLLLLSTPVQSNLPTLNIVQSYKPYYVFYLNTSVIKLAYDSVNQQVYTLKNYAYFSNIKTLFLHAALGDRQYLYGINLDYFPLSRNYMVWDWVFPLQDLTLIDFKADSTSVVLSLQDPDQSVSIVRLQSIGRANLQVPGSNGNQMPYLFSRDSTVAMYPGYNYDSSQLVDLSTDSSILNVTGNIFYAISPDGNLFAQKDLTQKSTLTVFRLGDIIGRVSLPSALNDTSRVYFISNKVMLQVTKQGTTRILNTFSFTQNPFSYSTYTYQATNVIRDGLSFNATHIAIQTSQHILVLDPSLSLIQTLSLAPIAGQEPSSISISDDGHLYAKYNDQLFVWSSEGCPDSQTNQEGVCADSSASSGSIIGIVGGAVGGAMVLGVGGYLFYRRRKSGAKKTLLDTEDISAAA